MTKVLAVASEVFPLVKTGGLADVVGALPLALSRQNVEMRVLVPGYPAVAAALSERQPIHRYKDLFGGPATLIAGGALCDPAVVEISLQHFGQAHHPRRLAGV